MDIIIPEHLTEFLYWVKERTEAIWSVDPATGNHEYKGEEWLFGAKWIGLPEEQIALVEEKYGIQFMPEHKEFLRILHTLDRKERREYTENFEEDGEVLVEFSPFYYNWLEDEEEIRERLGWPYKTIFQDVIGTNEVWLRSWGPRPRTKAEKEVIFANWIAKAPKLLPLTGHRFLVSDLKLEHRPVLSVWGSDTIVYGWNLRSYLLRELRSHLCLYEGPDLLKYLAGEDDYDPEKDPIAPILEAEYAYDPGKTIPYWEELIMIWCTGWSSFGLTFPGEEPGRISPIVKTWAPDDAPNEQKRFSAF